MIVKSSIPLNVFSMRRILLADDSASHRRIIKEALRALGDCEISEASDGREAIDTARKVQPDIVVMDLHMPGFNGAEATIALKRVRPEIRIILFTLYGEDIGPGLASAVGADLAIPKNGEGLVSLVHAVKTFLS